MRNTNHALVATTALLLTVGATPTTQAADCTFTPAALSQVIGCDVTIALYAIEVTDCSETHCALTMSGNAQGDTSRPGILGIRLDYSGDQIVACPGVGGACAPLCQGSAVGEDHVSCTGSVTMIVSLPEGECMSIHAVANMTVAPNGYRTATTGFGICRDFNTYGL